jgi:hypothetical protein
MAAYYPAALWTTPFRTFLIQKFFDSVFPDELEVFYHAQVIFSTIALIEGFQAFTGEVLTLIAEPDQSIAEQFAVFFHEEAVLTTRDATFAISPLEPVFVQSFFLRHITDT